MAETCQEKALLSKECVLRGHAAGVECLAISPDGRLLVSGDDDAVVLIWDLKTGEQIQSISCPFNGAIGAIAWIQFRDSDDSCFVFGCADGSLHLYRRKSQSSAKFEFVSATSGEFEGPIEDLCFDFGHYRLAAVGGDGSSIFSAHPVQVVTVRAFCTSSDLCFH
ncbi:WD40 repeat-like protein [Schizopora paradoxa]|uniref:WD40 repeat-like protein n=1 Tax=Schizopora paradoxa TaxID=27342 RepID=A0A0H2QYC4_9AGAM|nr:WD40 repeat-like protein [Schizopora paradoxa]